MSQMSEAERVKEIEQEVKAVQGRCGWSAQRVIESLGISVSSYHRWRTKTAEVQGVKLKSSQESILAEERQAIIWYALKHPTMRHREMAWRMIDDNVAFVSPSTTYRILKEEDLVCCWDRLKREKSDKPNKATESDEKWQTDLRYVKVGSRTYYLLVFIDEYSRYIVHHKLLRWMDGKSVALEAQAAIEKRGTKRIPDIQSDNGSCFISGDFARTLKALGVGHHRIHPHCPEQNGLVERSNRTLGEEIEQRELTEYTPAQETITGIVNWYNHKRLHSAIRFVTPYDKYKGTDEQIIKERKEKLLKAQIHRRTMNQQAGVN